MLDLGLHGSWKHDEEQYVIRYDAILSVISGTKYDGLNRTEHHWIANVKENSSGKWSGEIFYRKPEHLTFEKVEVSTINSMGMSKNLHVFLSSSSFYDDRKWLFFNANQFKPQYLRTVIVEMAAEENVDYVTSFNTHEHPNRPGELKNFNLTIPEVFRWASIEVLMVEGNKKIPLSLAGSDLMWDNNELHQAMLQHCMFKKDKFPIGWTIWLLNASNNINPDTSGIMFDEIENHRQGAAVFNNSRYFVPPPHDPNPDAWVKRAKFWTTIHEIGHCFNLTHSFQKEIGTPWDSSLKNDTNAYSFMNYSHNARNLTVQQNFFSNFYYTFTREEKLFMCHAPDEFVQMGNSNFTENHG
ncbi:zinc metalloprotease [Priestia endophytica]|uniref:Uncharacterized protein n=1 Tax=Priestia endophytica DSM 13796 TaxID=1121089 RepID=A0A1I6C0J5_9BACI|nr:hypothetical protein [Priestia endophytica]KYG33431.1 hypothetical protein AZF06_21540 [Priestia endophytica]SFQ86667.1 hypothetical protein SAMN02745910_04694 [Priestia endophytica DSM 13796]